MDELVATARRAARGEVGSVILPAKPGSPFTARFETSESGFLRGGTLTLDPATGRLLSRTTDSEGTPGHRLSTLMGDLHFA